MRGNHQWLRDRRESEGGKWVLAKVQLFLVLVHLSQIELQCFIIFREAKEGWFYTILDVGWERAGVPGQIGRMDGHGPTALALLYQLESQHLPQRASNRRQEHRRDVSTSFARWLQVMREFLVVTLTTIRRTGQEKILQNNPKERILEKIVATVDASSWIAGMERARTRSLS